VGALLLGVFTTGESRRGDKRYSMDVISPLGLLMMLTIIENPPTPNGCRRSGSRDKLEAWRFAV